MTIESHIDHTRRRIVARVVGKFTIADIRRVIDASVNDPDFEPGFDIFTDHTEVGDPITTEQVKQMVEHLRDRALAGARWAALVNTPASYGKLRMVQMLLRDIPIDVQIFTSRREAEAWLAFPRS